MRLYKTLGMGSFVFLVAFPIFMLVSFAVNSLVFPALLEWFPSVFSEPNFVKDREGYEALYNLLGLISGMVTVLLLSYISVRFDNERMEYMVATTEGMYTFSEGIRMYYPRYVFSDAALSVLVPLPFLFLDVFVIPTLDFLPYGVQEIINYFFLITESFTDFGGIGFGYIILVITLFLARLLSGLRAVDAYRALWLSDVEYVG